MQTTTKISRKEPPTVLKEAKDPVEVNRERLVRKVTNRVQETVRRALTPEMYDHFHRAQQEIERHKRTQEEIVMTAMNRIFRNGE